jgi:uncharacterized membrane protein YeaQ/YmgE (transglycosylase-associated protein family)
MVIAPSVGSRKERAVIGFIVAGLIIGALARLIRRGRQDLSLFSTLALGLAGSVIGGTIANLLGTGNVLELDMLGFIAAVISSVFLLGLAEGTLGSRRRR